MADCVHIRCEPYLFCQFEDDEPKPVEVLPGQEYLWEYPFAYPSDVESLPGDKLG